MFFQFLQRLYSDESPFSDMVIQPVLIRGQSAIRAHYHFRYAELLTEFVLQGLERRCLRSVARVDAECERNAVFVSEEPHLHDWIWTTLLRVSILTQSTFLLTLEVVVRTVIVDDGVVALAQFHTILVNVRLNVIHLFRKKRQCSIDLMYISFRLLNEAFRILQR